MQQQAYREFAAAHGWKIIKESYEKGIYGFKALRRIAGFCGVNFVIKKNKRRIEND